MSDLPFPSHPHVLPLQTSRKFTDTDGINTSNTGKEISAPENEGLSLADCQIQSVAPWSSNRDPDPEQFECLAKVLLTEIRAHSKTRAMLHDESKRRESLEQQVEQQSWDISSWASAYEDCCRCLNEHLRNTAGPNFSPAQSFTVSKPRPPPPSSEREDLLLRMRGLIKNRLSKEHKEPSPDREMDHHHQSRGTLTSVSSFYGKLDSGEFI